jgi:phosphopentomutase
MSGIKLERPFPVYPNGFPKDVISKFTSEIGTKILGNYPASGTEIINILGEEHMETAYPIVYTSADSVFQIAAHEDIIPLEKLYNMCEKAREILQGGHAVGRVIARPFSGKPGNFLRTKNRRDFSLEPQAQTMLDKLKESGYNVIAVGKIEDIFAAKGITYAIHTSGNMDGINNTLRLIKEENKGLIFTNLVDFDMLYGHRNDINGYKLALEEFDSRIPEIISALRKDDLLIITADHGCDPTTAGTDHSREFVPLLVYGKSIKSDVDLGTRETFADIACTVLDIFGIESNFRGKSFMKEI